LTGAPYVPPQQKSGCGKILLILGIVLLLIGAGVVAAIYFGFKKVESNIKSSEAYTIALKALKEHPEVIEKMGEIKKTGFPIGSFSVNGDGTGMAAYTMSVEGTKASGNYRVAMRRSGGQWRLITGVVTLNDGESINIVSPGDVDFDGSDDESNANENLNMNHNMNHNMPMPPVLGKPSPTSSPGMPRAPISGGVLNGKAISLPKPAYPAVARAARASGTVVVQVTVDEEGNVISARAVSGHPLLQASATSAARQAKFSPTKLAGQPVKVTGVITYNFVLE
jgi:TonB family protein